MKNKIRLRLLLYFTGSLLIFSLIIGLVFSTFFSRHNMDVHTAELGKRAEHIAETLAGIWLEEPARGQGPRHNHGMSSSHGYGAYLKLLDDITIADIWIFDRSLGHIVRGHGRSSLAYKELPLGAEEAIASAVAGKSTFSKAFGAFIGEPSVTVATPITLPDNEVAGVVLLHEKIGDIQGATKSGLTILLSSMGVAILISFFIASILAGSFTRPLDRMKTAAKKISGGDYAITTGVAQDDEIGELARALDSMAVKLEIASRESENLEQLRRDFIANISHELRTPVTVIRGSLEALSDGVVSEPNMVDDYHQQMLAESIYLERLVSDLLDLARLQNPDFAMDMQDINLKTVVEDARRSMTRLAKPRNVNLKLSIEGNDFTFHGDYGRLRQMLMIVLDNAIKFTPVGSVVQLTMKGTLDGIILCISDEGLGIPADELPHIFERFHKQRSEENKGGTGLGLAIAKHIADRHGINIGVKSEPGQGTKFTFII
ncbi:MAG TPA: ATP-binding protein [Clostridia bacterium]|nr:ATP-binding protein [Clostridia bacterium]